MMESPERHQTADLDDLLVKSSRTFALSIPLLPEPTRREVTVAYLLFRIADTFEDATKWSREERRDALALFVNLLEVPLSKSVHDATQAWLASPPVDHDGYMELIEQTPSVLGAFAALDDDAREQVMLHTIRTSVGMSEFIARGTSAGELQLTTLQDLRDYCYVVAGIVGEMLTELFILGHPDAAERANDLRTRARAFGEGLQLVNILKDSAADDQDGRCYLPPGVERDTVFDLAREDLDRAAEYTGALQACGAPRGMIAFNALPILLARGTLDRVQRAGPGAKLTRDEVFDTIATMNAALDSGEPAVTP